MNEIIEKVYDEIKKLHEKKRRVIVAIDGGAASGKTTVASALAEKLGAAVIHTDDFFLRPEQRTPARYAQAGGNIDYERFSDEVACKIRSGAAFSYRRFDCGKMALGETVLVPECDTIIVEGTYSCHEKFFGMYDLSVFLDIGGNVQRERIAKRNKDMAKTFFEKWIPLENAYFSGQNVKKRCSLSFEIK